MSSLKSQGKNNYALVLESKIIQPLLHSSEELSKSREHDFSEASSRSPCNSYIPTCILEDILYYTLVLGKMIQIPSWNLKRYK